MEFAQEVFIFAPMQTTPWQFAFARTLAREYDFRTVLIFAEHDLLSSVFFFSVENFLAFLAALTSYVERESFRLSFGLADNTPTIMPSAGWRSRLLLETGDRVYYPR